jgi:hypothetical protein
VCVCVCVCVRVCVCIFLGRCITVRINGIIRWHQYQPASGINAYFGEVDDAIVSQREEERDHEIERKEPHDPPTEILRVGILQM